jgi:hypothetical protein
MDKFASRTIWTEVSLMELLALLGLVVLEFLVFGVR